MPFVFPYAEEEETRRAQIWDNLLKGILFEDTQLFIPWNTSYEVIDTLAEQKRESGDRTTWFLGKHSILHGYPCYVGVMKWLYIKPSEPFKKIEEYLGTDAEGYERFQQLRQHLTNVLGTPDTADLEQSANMELGTISWTRSNVMVALTGIEQFDYKYRLFVGLNEW